MAARGFENLMPPFGMRRPRRVAPSASADPFERQRRIKKIRSTKQRLAEDDRVWTQPIVPQSQIPEYGGLLPVEVRPADFIVGGRPYTSAFKDVMESSPLMHDPGTPFAGYVYGGGDPRIYLKHNLYTEEPFSKGMRESTIPHEVGHRISGIVGLDLPEFGRRVDEYLKSWKDQSGFMPPQAWDLTAKRMSEFHGVGENALRDFSNSEGETILDWGGYGELYSEMFSWSEGEIDRIPPALRDYYEDWLGPSQDLDRAIATSPRSQTSYLHRANAEANNEFWRQGMRDLVESSFPGRTAVEFIEDGQVKLDDGTWIQIPEHILNMIMMAAKTQWAEAQAEARFIETGSQPPIVERPPGPVVVAGGLRSND